MRIVIQRVKNASVDIDGRRHSEIGCGLMILLGIEDRDTDEDIDYLCHKVVQMRIFPDADGVMNLRYQLSGLSVMVYGSAFQYLDTEVPAVDEAPAEDVPAEA